MENQIELIKFCKNAHLPANAKSMRIGTLGGYRTIENEEIKDPLEGRQIVTVKLRNVAVSPEWFNKVLCLGMCQVDNISPGGNMVMSGSYFTLNLQNLRVPGTVKLIQDRLHVVGGEGGKFIVSGEAQFDLEFGNLPVFCMSVSDGKNKIPFTSYDCAWRIGQNSISAFSRFLRREIKKQIFLENVKSIGGHDLSLKTNFDNHGLKEMRASLSCDREAYLVNTLGVDVEFHKVIYDKIEFICSRETDLDWTTLLSLFRKCLFSKPKRFEHEREVRFVLTPYASLENSRWCYALPAASHIDLQLNAYSRDRLLGLVQPWP